MEPSPGPLFWMLLMLQAGWLGGRLGGWAVRRGRLDPWSPSEPDSVLLLLLLPGSAVLLAGPSGPGPGLGSGSVVSESSVSGAAGARAELRCQSPRMVWTQDRLRDRQRVVHWDVAGGPERPARRVLDMYSAGEQRVYEARDRGRLQLAPSAFLDGNFSLLIREVRESDAGLYSCNLHHHYCHLYESRAVQLDVVGDPAAARAFWDGEKEVLVAALGAPALLHCENRAPVWTDRHLEEAQQVAHWDRQPPGVPHDRADRLLDLYASGERRAYGPRVLRDRVAVPADAFARGDFSLRIDPLQPADEGTYSCHLHHHYCGLHERRVFHLRVTAPPPPPPPSPPRGSPGNGSGPGPDPTQERGRSVINVIVPEGRAHFFQHLGYVLATLLLFILLLITVILAARQRRCKDARPPQPQPQHARGSPLAPPLPAYEPSEEKPGTWKGTDLSMAEWPRSPGNQAPRRSEDIPLDYKNNILKERAGLALSPLPAKNVDLDKELRKEYCK
ncbi:matrix remodeling-associated protein 8 [Suncus etruscus]|uniref:matrix remodeling-associated protein 8 n=1 Tax=Suncus etruscus TaxID=109475 RepID=UPI00210F85D7|nr:matrix remodeling-associated protein 8 [Suncus etruscus]